MKCCSIPCKLCLILLLSLGSASMGSAAQIEPAWSVIIYDHGLNALVDLSSTGYDITPLPDIGYPPPPDEEVPGWYEYLPVKMTDNRRYLVSLKQGTQPYFREAVITDLITGEVIPVATLPLDDGETFVGYWWFGAFNPAMTEIALPYVSHDVAFGGACCNLAAWSPLNLPQGLLLTG